MSPTTVENDVVLGTFVIGTNGSNRRQVNVPGETGHLEGQIQILPELGTFIQFDEDGKWVHWDPEPPSDVLRGVTGTPEGITLDWNDPLTSNDQPQVFAFTVRFAPEGFGAVVIKDPTVENDPPPNE